MESDTFGFLSIIPPLVAIVLAIRTRQVIVSLIVGLLIGYIIIAKGNIFTGMIQTSEGLINVFKSGGNTKTIVFTLLIGSLIRLIQYSGGVQGFVKRVQSAITKSKNPKSKLQLAAGITGFLIFIESNISILTVGTVFQSLFKRFKIPKEKLAYLADSSSAPACILIPLNAWGAYVMGLLAAYEGVSPFATLLAAIPLNFYALFTLIMVFYLAISNKSYGPMRHVEKVSADAEKEQETETVIVSGETEDAKMRYMIIPLMTMVLSMPLFLFYTGWDPAFQGSFGERLWTSIANASGSSAVMYSVILAVVVAGIYFRIRKKLTLNSFIEESMEGMREMLSMAVLMLLAFAIGALCNELGTGAYVASVTKSWLSPALIPAVIFLTSCFIAFSTGTSWGTFAIMISIAVPLAQEVPVDINLVVAAVLGGGVFGDHCSPISDTTLIASMATKCDHIDHVRTQLPYALLTGGLALIGYLIAGFISL